MMAGRDSSPLAVKGKGKPVPDASLRETENVPLGEGIAAYFRAR